MPLHPFITALIEKQMASGWGGLAAGTPEEARAFVATSRTAIGQGPAMEVQTCAVPSRAGAIPARLYRPSPDADRLILYVHGGGWVVGALDDYDTLARTLAARANSIVLLPDYRLAPEHPFPAGLQDIEDTLLWCRTGAASDGRDLPLVVAGDSAGANLGTVAARRLMAQVAVALQVLVYPVADSGMDTGSYSAHGEGLPLTAKDMAWFFAHYARPDQHSDPDIAPLRAGNLAALPPALVLLAEYDVLRDEGEAYADRLRAAGVPVGLRQYNGVTHGFLRLHNLLSIADDAVNDIAHAIRAGAPETKPA